MPARPSASPCCRRTPRSRSRGSSRWPDTSAIAMSNLDWLIARPVAHRGLHNAQKNVIENTPSAFAAAIAGGYGIECDLQITADGEAMVHHDEALGRLTEGDARLDTMTAADLKHVPFKATADH